MKKVLKSVFMVALCFMFGLGLTACKPKNVDKAISRMEKAGYTIVGYTDGEDAEGYVDGFVASNVESVNEIDGMMALLFESKSDAKEYFNSITENENKSMFGEWVLDGKWVYTGSEAAVKAFLD